MLRVLPRRAKRVVAAVLAVCCLAPACLATTVATAAETLACASLEESAAFRMRHLQSRLMVSALSCNQQAAYNTFVEHFRATLVDSGSRLNDYFQRVGGGQSALNRHITDLANAAGLSRAENPDTYCKEAWDVFWNLEQNPQLLTRFAEESLFTVIAQPKSCAVTVAGPLNGSPQNVTAAFDAAKAAADKSNR